MFVSYNFLTIKYTGKVPGIQVWVGDIRGLTSNRSDG